MKSSSRAQHSVAPRLTRPSASRGTEPRFENPSVLTDPSRPTTPAELVAALGLTVETSIEQIGAGKKNTRHQDYALPWAGFTSWRDARGRLAYFESHCRGRVEWVPFNDSASNDGPMSLNAYPGRAFIERVTNAGDANLELKALTQKGAMPTSPAEAVGQWFGLSDDALISGMNDDDVRRMAQETVEVTAFVGDGRDDHKASIFDARDYGIGLSADEMPGTILSLNRGNKKCKAWLTGKHGQGASSTYQYADLTLIVSRKSGSPDVSFTLVEATWDTGEKTPTYKYMTIDGKIPSIELPEALFAQGTLVRHIGYNAADLFNPYGENSLYGLLRRALAKPLFPVWLEMYLLKPSTAGGYPTRPGYRLYGRTIRGTIIGLERAWRQTLASPPSHTCEASQAGDGVDHSQQQGDAADKQSTGDVNQPDGTGPAILHRKTEHYCLPRWDYGGRTGMGELGSVRFTYWVLDSRGRSDYDTLRNWVDPAKTILMTLDGQTHAEESRAIVTGKTGANLWAVGRWMVVQIDCDGLDPRAKYELFTSTREHAKETPIKKMILEELVRRLSFDQELKDLNTRLAAADVKHNTDDDERIASLIKKYLKTAGISFEQLTRKAEKWTDVLESQQGHTPRPKLPPIESKEPPTFVHWKFSATVLKLYPGQRHSAVFETDASPAYWNSADQRASRIKVLANGVTYVGAGEMDGGRVRCHFECPDNATVGAKGSYIQVQLEYDTGESKKHDLPVEIVEKPKPKPKKKDEEQDKSESDADKAGDGKGVIKVKIRKKDFTEVEIPVVHPQAVERKDSVWQSLGWPYDPGQVGFSIRTVQGKIHLYYNAEFPPLLDLKRRMSKKSLEDEFVRRYRIKLVLHTIFSLNYDYLDEDEFQGEARARVRNALCATAESLALATKSELEIESRLKSEDGVPLGTVVGNELSKAVEATAEETPDSE